MPAPKYDDLKRLQETLDLRPEDQDLREELCALLLEREEWQPALSNALLLVQLAPVGAFGHLAIARCHLEEGRVPDARLAFETARRCPDFHERMGQEGLLFAAIRARLAEAAPTPIPVEREGERIGSVEGELEKVSFEDIAGLEELKALLRLRIIEPFRRPELFEKYGQTAGGGILLYGPPGCGKTMIAKAIATECRAKFFSVGISDILSKWLGESERNLKDVFQAARDSRPAVLFFDELDALAVNRGSGLTGFHGIVNEFLSQLDGLGRDNKGILVLGATNMPWNVDPAMKRPGRFDRAIFVPPPDEVAREALFELKVKGSPVDVKDFSSLAAKSEFFSGADIKGVIDRAREAVLSEILAGGPERDIGFEDLRVALDGSRPSTMEWLRTVATMLSFGSKKGFYEDLEAYLRRHKLVG